MSLKSDIRRISVKEEEKVHFTTKGKMYFLRIKKNQLQPYVALVMELEDLRQALRPCEFLSLHCKKEESISSCRVVFKT